MCFLKGRRLPLFFMCKIFVSLIISHLWRDWRMFQFKQNPFNFATHSLLPPPPDLPRGILSFHCQGLNSLWNLEGTRHLYWNWDTKLSKKRGAIPKVKWEHLNSYIGKKSSFKLTCLLTIISQKNHHLSWIRNSCSSILPKMLSFACFKHQTNISIANGLLPISGMPRNPKWSHSWELTLTYQTLHILE